MKRRRRAERREAVNARAASRLAGGPISPLRTPANPPAETVLIPVSIIGSAQFAESMKRAQARIDAA